MKSQSKSGDYKVLGTWMVHYNRSSMGSDLEIVAVRVSAPLLGDSLTLDIIRGREVVIVNKRRVEREGALGNEGGSDDDDHNDGELNTADVEEGI